ncbi:MAG: dipeptidyl peptidase 3 [Bacteroidales bacterium]|nr:dipeptidyl peptidase 3 [Bacteroidales bacterium]
MAGENGFQYHSEQFADIRILRYKIPGFGNLGLKQKKLLYYLYEAGLAGRDIIWDQNYKYNLLIRHVLENIVRTFSGNRNTESWKNFMVYVKRVWFSNGIHHHYSTDKIIPDISRAYFKELLQNSDPQGFPKPFQSTDELIDFLLPLIFDEKLDAKRVVQDSDKDIVAESAANFYEGVTREEVERYYNAIIDHDDPEPVSYGLNSKLVKENGRVVEKVWKTDGLYGEALTKVVFWLEKAEQVAENPKQAEALKKLIEYFKTGELRRFDEYNILWLQDTESFVDFINGFIEVYGDPLGRKGTFESLVSVRDEEATRRAKTISDHAAWFEWHSPTHEAYKKQEIKGVNGKAIHVVAESGDTSPATPIGVNLPNSDWLRTKYGSKSVTLSNILDAHDIAGRETGVLEEFAYSDKEIQRARKHGLRGTKLHVDLHEIVGHGSGKIKEGVGDPSKTLKNYASTIEETRADLVALYFALDPKLIELKLMPDVETGKAEYDAYIRGGLLTQLARIAPGRNLEESHMRNRQLIAQWAYHKSKHQNVIEKKVQDGKTYFLINDYELLREFFGILLKEVQRIKSEGDYEAARRLVETYGVKVDRELHDEVLERWNRLNIAPYTGFINPSLEPVIKDDEIKDVHVEYPDDFAEQMLYYGKYYSALPITL